MRPSDARPRRVTVLIAGHISGNAIAAVRMGLVVGLLRDGESSMVGCGVVNLCEVMDDETAL